MPVIVSVPGGAEDNSTAEDVAPPLRSHVSIGGVSGLMRADAPWTADLARTWPNGLIFPSIALMTASQCWHRGQIPAMAWTPDAIELRYTSDINHRVDVTSVAEMPDQNADLGLRRGSLFAEFMIEVPTDRDLDDSSVDYRDVLRMSEANLRDRFNDKVMLIADYRRGADGPFPHPDGRAMPGSVMHAVAIERLLSGDVLKRPRFIAAFGTYLTSAAPIVLFSSMIGATVGWWASQRTILRISTYAVVAIVIVAAALVSFRLGGFIYLPLSPLLCIVTAGEVVAFISRARESTI